MEALRAAVATVVQYDKWDEVLSHVTFGLNTHVSTATKLSPFEFAHGSRTRPSHYGTQDSTPTPGLLHDKTEVTLVQWIGNHHNETSDHMDVNLKW